ncbi:MAG: serpin family protein [Myxococcaceae bacterium]|nr:serpin family protein [Myxococcaceae bacterium]
MLRSLALVVVVLSSCADLRDLAPPGEDVSSTAQRITQAAPDPDVEAASVANTALGLALLARHPDGNFIFSPYSITSATSMLEAGARGDTQTGIIKALKQTLPEAQHHRAMNTLEAAIESRGATAKGKDGKPFRLIATNQLFGQRGQRFEQAYLDTLKQEYGAGIRLLDFSTDAARVSINQWVGQRTEGKIPNLFAPNSLLGARLAVVNTLYFNAAWEDVFDKAATKPHPFTLLDGAKIDVAMMRNPKLKGAKAALVDGTQVLELPYDGQDVSLVVVAPPVGKFADVVGGLDGAKLHGLITRAGVGGYDVRLPKFKFDTSLELAEDLKALGMTHAFDAAKADFSGMTGQPELFVGVAVHQAVIILDESGTEAAAATGFGTFTTSVPPPPTEVIIDRPFLFFIRDVKTGLVLFAGRVVNPS